MIADVSLTPLQQAIVDELADLGGEFAVDSGFARIQLAERLLEQGKSSSLDSAATGISQLKTMGVLDYPSRQAIRLRNGDEPRRRGDTLVPSDDETVVVDGEPTAVETAYTEAWTADDHDRPVERDGDDDGPDADAVASALLRQALDAISRVEQVDVIVADYERRLDNVINRDAFDAVSAELDEVKAANEKTRRDLRKMTRERDEAHVEVERLRSNLGAANAEIVRLREEAASIGRRMHSLSEEDRRRLAEWARIQQLPPGR